MNPAPTNLQVTITAKPAGVNKWCPSCQGKYRKTLLAYALLNIIVYAVLVMIGVFSLNTFLLSFELLLLVTAPSIIFLLVLNGWRYFKYRDSMDLVLLITWLWLGVIFAAYFIYLVLGVTDVLWARGIWFSENDVLHIGLISWMVYIAVFVAKRITDRH